MVIEKKRNYDNMNVSFAQIEGTRWGQLILEAHNGKFLRSWDGAEYDQTP